MDRLLLEHDSDLAPGTWWGQHLEKPYIACPKCGGTLLGPPAPHTIETNGDVNGSVVCGHSGCDFHRYVRLEEWAGDKREKA